MKNPSFSVLSLAALLVLGLSAASFGQRRPVATGTGGTQDLADTLSGIEEHLTAIHTASNRRHVPFRVEAAGGLGNAAIDGSSNPEILIESDGNSGHFVVTSILVKTNVPLTGFAFLSVNSLDVNGTRFDTRTQNLVEHVGTGVNESADLMGAPIRVDSLGGTNPPTGGNFPFEIIAENDGSGDVRIQLFCRSDVSDLDIEVVGVSGWKRPGDMITATFVPGS